MAEKDDSKCGCAEGNCSKAEEWDKMTPEEKEKEVYGSVKVEKIGHYAMQESGFTGHMKKHLTERAFSGMYPVVAGILGMMITDDPELGGSNEESVRKYIENKGEVSDLKRYIDETIRVGKERREEFEGRAAEELKGFRFLPKEGDE